MEVKSNVKQRRMNRIKQLSESTLHPTKQPNWYKDEDLYKNVNRVKEPLVEETDLRFQDPEFAWKQRDRFRNEKAVNWGPVHYKYEEYESNSNTWFRLPTSRQLWVRVGVAALLFAVSLGTFQTDHPYALKGREWITKALTEDYNFALAAAWYESKFSGLPAILPASWRQEATESQKVSTVNARQIYAPVSGKILAFYTAEEPMIKVETTSGEAKAIDSGRILSVQTSADQRVLVVIQHADGLQSTYGGLSESGVKKFDWIKGGETVGRIAVDKLTNTGRLMFAVKKDNQWLNPADVVPFD